MNLFHDFFLLFYEFKPDELVYIVLAMSMTIIRLRAYPDLKMVVGTVWVSVSVCFVE